MVGARGFEPPASWSRTRRSTKLSHAPNFTSVARASERDIIKVMSTPLGTVRKSLYDTDFVEWSTRTADLLRRGRLAGLDLENVAEEIEDLGKSERSAVRSQLRRMLVHLVKSRIQPERSGAIWRGSVASARTEILDHFGDSPSLRKHTEINLQRIHREAVELALVETNLAAHEANPHIPEECPYTPGDPARRRLPHGLPVLRG